MLHLGTSLAMLTRHAKLPGGPHLPMSQPAEHLHSAVLQRQEELQSQRADQAAALARTQQECDHLQLILDRQAQVCTSHACMCCQLAALPCGNRFPAIV